MKHALLSLALMAAAPAAAHPHVFVDAGLELRLDGEGRLASVRIVWVYDDFTSMLLLGDLGLMPDREDRLSPQARAALQGFDMQWDEGFAGDTHMRAADAPVALSPPRDWTADYVQGRIVTTHVRDLVAPVDPATAPVTVQLYDPGYYTAYTIAVPPKVTGRDDCAAEVLGPDTDAAIARLEAALEELVRGGVDPETDFPAVGAAFAEEVRLTCPAPF
jgi:polyphosphate kinase